MATFHSRPWRTVLFTLLALVAGASRTSAASNCPSDLNRDGRVNDADLAQLMGSWAAARPDDPSSIPGVTLAQLIGDWGPCPPSAAPSMQLGVATGGINAYLRDGRPFSDRLLAAEVHARGFPVTYDGWPIPSGEQAAYFLTDSGACLTPPGAYVLRYEGSGQVMASDRGATGPQPAKQLLASGAILTVLPDHRQGVQIVVRQSDPANPVRELSFVPVGADPRSSDPAWVGPLRGWCNVIRFLGWNRLESHIPLEEDVILHAEDVPSVETRASMNSDADPALAVKLAADTSAHPWVCVMDGADEGYYRAFARALKAEARPWQRIIVEYSNEAAWNSQFAQFHRVNRRGLAAGLGGARRQYAREALACFRIMREELGDAFRGVLTCQLANPYVARDILDEAASAPDFRSLVSAIAPSWYWYPSLTPESHPAGVSVRQLVDDCAQSINGPMREQLTRHAEIAREFGLELWTYEGGPHPPGALSGHPFYQQYHASDEIAENYAQAIAVCREVGVRLLIHMGYCGDPATSTWFLGPDPETVEQAARFRAFRAGAEVIDDDGVR